MKSRSEKPQPGNPHRLTLRQHVFPAKSIARFVQGGGVELIDFARGLRRRAGSGDAIFCADRAWNHGAEAGWMKRIEIAFQALADSILSQPRAALSTDETAIITEFYALWQARAERRHLPQQRVVPNGTLGVRIEHGPDALERLEKGNIMATGPDGSFAMRDLNAAGIQLAMGRIQDHLEGKPWGLIDAIEGEFLVPDVPAHGIVPITPRLAMVAGQLGGRVTLDGVHQINGAMAKHAREYLFARSLDACPGIPPALFGREPLKLEAQSRRAPEA